MNIEKFRKKANMTQLELANALGVTQTCVGKWETGGINPRASMIPKIAEVLNCTIGDLYGEE